MVAFIIDWFIVAFIWIGIISLTGLFTPAAPPTGIYHHTRTAEPPKESERIAVALFAIPMGSVWFLAFAEKHPDIAIPTYIAVVIYVASLVYYAAKALWRLIRVSE